METPILFLVFNRPDTTIQVFESIRLIKPKRLYIACDGPRKDNVDDRNNIEKVRRILENIDWECQIYKKYREKNLGCKISVSDAINWFFENEEKGIILEDDTLPSKSFYPFCELMLEKYKDKKVIMHIGGHKPLNIGKDSFSISFTKATHVWGWATWRDRWKNYSVDLKDIYNLDILPEFEYFERKRKIKKRTKLLKMIKNEKLDTWDYQWNFAVRTNGGLAIRPSVNLVKNIGIGHENASHTFKRSQIIDYEEIDLQNLKFPPWILPNRKLEAQFERNL